MAQNNTGRFQVSQRIVVMQYQLKINGHPASHTFSPVTYIPWSSWMGDMVLVGNGVKFKVLTVTEELDVPWDQDPKGEKKYKGYLLKDDDGNVRSNQYPHASYGQTTTSSDYHFEKRFPDDVDFETLTDDDLSVWEAAPVRFDKIKRSITDLNIKQSTTEATLLTNHLAWLTKKIEAALRVTVSYMQIYPSCPTFTKTVIEWL